MLFGSLKIRRPGTRQFLLAGVWTILVAPLIVAMVAHATLTSKTTEADYDLFPVQNVVIQQPMAMLLLSRDDKLFIRAFTDYTDLDGDGSLDTTYNNNFDYGGYFDSDLCYKYTSASDSSAPGQFEADNKATATTDKGPTHTCSGEWSGNFLNWLTMSRIDEERYVLYGGRRVVDTTDSTVLQRAYIPNDGHAWVKVYSGSDIGSYTPYSEAPYSFCNATIGTMGTDSSADTAEPLLRVAKGSWPSWAASNNSQCLSSTDTASTTNPDPSSGAEFPSATAIEDKDVLVKVCGGFSSDGNTVRESFCTAYSDGSTTYHKPTGLLQAFASKIRFGLMTGTWQNPRSGGVLRRNIGLIQGNGDDTCTDARNEINEKTGQFCYIENSKPAMAGIINALDNFRVYGWTRNASNDQQYSDCSDFGIQNRQDKTNAQSVPYLKDPGLTSGSNAKDCSEWGNPLAGLYAEALRYIQHFDSDGSTVLAPTSTFINNLTIGGDGSNASTTGGGGASGDKVPNLPAPKWLDPYSSTDGTTLDCAQCNIVVLSTGEPSFDGNSPEVPTVSALAEQAYEATNTVGNQELGSSAATSQYLVGRLLGSSTDGTVNNVLPTSNGYPSDSSANECVQVTVSSLGLVRGICPEDPSTEGSYYLAGLAYEAWTNDMRPDLDPDGSSPHNIKTYTIQLSEPLPSFNIYTGTFTSGSPDRIMVIPNCTISDSSGSSRRCGFMNLKVGPITNPDTGRTYGLPAGTYNGHNYGSYTVYWSDSPYGSHYGISAIQVLSYCVGDSCLQSNVQAYMCKQQNTNDPTSPNSPGKTGSATICKNGAIGVGTQLDKTVYVRTEMVYHASSYSMSLGFSELGFSNTNVKNQVWPGTSGTSVGTFLLGTTGDTGTDTNVSTTYDWQTPTIQNFTGGPFQQILLSNPLYLAAKYGGFTYTAGTLTPLPSQGDASDWDAVNNTTNEAGQDGLPDNYFYVSDPKQLSNALKGTFLNILLRAGSGTAAAVVANHVNGIGVAYRSTYLPTVSPSDPDDKTTVSWAGTLDTLWVDGYGLLRENGKAGSPAGCSSGCQLSSDYTVDPIVVFTTDATSKRPEFKECVPNAGVTFDPGTFDPANTDVTCTLHELSDLATIWNAESQLWGSFSDLTTNRASYGDKTGTGRYIFTDLYDSSKNTYQQIPFVWNSDCTQGGFCGSNSGGKVTGNFGYLNTDGNADEAENIINWVRGVEVSGMRSRTITTSCASFDVPGCPTADTSLTLRLGDIVDSTPLVVTSPSENYDLIYGDTSYGTFRSHYANRRQMVYVGANDGMLHAFNGGFFDASKHRLDLEPQTSCDSSGCTADTDIIAHPLGGEMWAYVPGDLLPHLRWLTDTAYQAGTQNNLGEHVFYVDGSPVATDAKVFADDATHPGGWGTILVVPFHLGGGDIKVPVPLDSSQSYDPTNCDNTSTTNCYYLESFPSYVVLDVTDPEQAPKVLAELSPASIPNSDKSSTALGTESYTTSEPAFAVVGEGTTTPHFYMFIGSGPTGPITTGTAVTSTQPLRVYAYDLACLADPAATTGCPTSPNTPLTVSTKTNTDGSAITDFDLSNGGGLSQGEDSFAGDLIASDFDLDGNAEAVYFGSVRDDKTDGSYSGSLWKITLDGSSDPTSWTGNLMYDPKAPITIRPTLGLNTRGAPMVYAGTGRLLDGFDQQTDDQQYIFGMIDPYLLPTGDAQLDFKADPVPSPMLAASDLVDISNLGVCVQSIAGTPCENNIGGLINSQDTSSGTTPSGASFLPTGITTFAQLQQLFDCPKTVDTNSTTCTDAGKAGFVLDLSRSAGSPSERVVSAQALLGGVLVTNTYIPDDTSCDALGTGNEYAQDFETGTANPAATLLGVNDNGTGATNVALGPGIPSAPSLHAGAANQSNSKAITACTQTSTGAIICQKVASIFPVTSGEVSWREPLDQ